MHKIKIITFILVFLCVFMLDITTKKVYADNKYSEIVMDAYTKRVLYESNANEKKYMASTTKILTALCVIENCNLDEEVIIKKETTGIEGSSIYLEEGEKLTVKELLYGLMLRSGNDCAETLAKHLSGSIENFARLMNKTAIKIGAKNSHFVNPHGLHDDNHYTTAYDLALISSYAIQNDTFKNIVSTKKTVIPFTTKNTTRVLINKNKLLSSLDGATGIKTGYTKKAGRCLVSSCNRDGHEIVCVVLNCPPMFEKSAELINKAFNDYSYDKYITKDDILDFCSIKDSSEKCGIICKEDVFLPLKSNEKENLKIEYNIPKFIDKNIDKNEPIGDIKFFCGNNLIFTEKVYTIIDVKINKE